MIAQDLGRSIQGRRDSPFHAGQIDGIFYIVSRQVKIFDPGLCSWPVGPGSDRVDKEGYFSIRIQFPAFNISGLDRQIFADLLQYDDTAELGRISVPALLLWGAADALVSRSMQDQPLALIPTATLITYEGLGHTPRWDAPARVAADIAAFMPSLPHPH